MTKKELAAIVAEKTETSKAKSEEAVNAAFEAIKDALVAGDKVQILGFGTFEIRERAARTGRNPQTGEEITIEASKNVHFKAGKALKDVL